MKTLPTSEVPTIAIISTQRFQWLYHEVSDPLFQTVFLDYSNPSTLDTIRGGTWYKVVLLVDVFAPTQPIVDLAGSIASPTLVFLPCMTELPQAGAAGLAHLTTVLEQRQEMLMSMLAGQFSAACLVLVDGLLSSSGFLELSRPVVEILGQLQPQPEQLLGSRSIITQQDLVKWLQTQISLPNLPQSCLLRGQLLDSPRFRVQIERQYLNQYKHELGPIDSSASNPPSIHVAHLPKLRTEAVQSNKNPHSLLGASLPQPGSVNQLISDATAQLGALVTPLPKAGGEIGAGQATSTSKSIGQWAQATSSDNVQAPTLASAPPPRTPPPPVTNQKLQSSAQSKNTTSEGGAELPTVSNPPPPPSSPPPPPTTPAPKNTTIDRLVESSTLDSDTQQLDNKLHAIFSEKRRVEKTQHLAESVKATKVVTAKTRRRKSLFVVGSLLTGFSLAVVFFSGLYTVSAAMVEKQNAGQLALITLQSAAAAQPSKTPFYSLLSFQNSLYQYVFSDELLHHGLTTATTHSLLTRLTDLSARLETEKSAVLAQLFNQQPAEPNALETLAALTQTQLDIWREVAGNGSSPTGSSEPSQSDETELVRNKSLFIAFAPILTDILGLNGSRSYAVVFQNNQELRPTGGFIQSVAVFDLENGQIKNPRVYSSYDIDRLLGGKVEPPPDLTTFLGEKSLFFRDSNWFADFPTTAQKMLWFLNKSLNREIDGVWAVTTPAMAHVLDAVGPVELPQFAETVTAKNLFDRLEYHSEVQGLTANQPQEYSATLLQTVFDKLESSEATAGARFLTAFRQSLDAQDSLLFLQDESAQQKIVDVGWSGEILTPPCPSTFANHTCRVEPIYQVETNIGVNKANQYLKKRVQHTIKIDESILNHVHQITYENQASSTAWPKGPYRAYERYYLPPGAVFQSASISGTLVPPKEVLLGEEGGRPIVGLAIDVPVGETKEVSVAYTTPPLASDEALIYFEQKQPGTQLNTTVTVLYDPSRTPKQIAPEAELSPGRAEFVPKPQPHLLVGILL